MQEITLRQLIESFFRRKHIAVIIIIVCIIISIIYSFIPRTPQNELYESNATIALSPVIFGTGITLGTTIFSIDANSSANELLAGNKMFNSVIKSLYYPQYGVDKYVMVMNSDEYLNSIYTKVGLNPSDAIKQFELKIQKNANGNSIDIALKGSNPEICKKVKNEMINSISVFVSAKIEKEFENILIGLNKREESEYKLCLESKNKLDSILRTTPNKEDIEKLPFDRLWEYQQVLYKYNLSNQVLESYQIIKKEVENIKLTDINQAINLQISSSTEKSPKKLSDNTKYLNIITALLVGIILSLFIILFLEYWEKSGKIKGMSV